MPVDLVVTFPYASMMNKVWIKRLFECRAEVLWRAWTEPERMREWFGSDPLGRVHSAEVSFRIGGGFSVSFENSDGRSFVCYGRYLEIVSVERLVFEWGWHPDELNEIYELLFVAADEATMLDFTIKNVSPNGSHDYVEGWTKTFAKLEKVVTRS